MKKILLLAGLAFSVNATMAYSYNQAIVNNTIKEDQVIEYCKSENIWNKKCPESLKFTKHYTTGSGGFSEYELNKITYDTDTTYEFLLGEKLVGYNPYKLQFYYLTFADNKFERTMLTDGEIKSLFPNVEIVKISQFKNDTITLYKPFFKPKTFLFVNDTDKEFYKYQFEHYKKQTELIHGIFEPKRAGTYIYSHFGGRDKEIPPLKIVVKNKF